MADKKFKDYEDYFMNRTVADIMEEYSEQEDEWKPILWPQKEEGADDPDKKVTWFG